MDDRRRATMKSPLSRFLAQRGGPAGVLLLASFALLYVAWDYRSFILPGLVDGLFGAGYGDIDGSWILALNWARSLHLPWLGNSLVFPYGPLFFLSGFMLQEFHSLRALLVVSVALNLLYAAGFTYVLALFADLPTGTRRWWAVLIAGAVLLLQAPDMEFLPLIAAFILLPVFLDRDAGKTRTLGNRMVRYALALLLLAALPLVKFSHMFEALAILVTLTVFLVWSRKYAEAVLPSALFVIVTVVLWPISTGQGISTILPYLASKLQLVSGYTEAMMLGFIQPQDPQIFTLALLYMLVLGGALLYLVLNRQTAWAIAWTLPMFSLYLGFKEAFVRAEYRGVLFLPYVLLSAVYYFYLLEALRADTAGNGEKDPWSSILAPGLMVVLGLVVVSTISFRGTPLHVSNEFFGLGRAFDTSSTNQAVGKEYLRQRYNLDPGFVAKIDTRASIDILPWDIALLYGYGLNWRPRPVIQTYSSYTPALDALDASYFRSRQAPDQLIISPSDLDNRYLPFDTPWAFRAIIDRYEFVDRTEDGRYALLRKRGGSSEGKWVPIGAEQLALGEQVTVPRVEAAHLFMAVDIQPTLLGRLLILLYKPTPISVEIKGEGLEAYEYRFIRATAVDGLFVSKYVRTVDDLQSALDETYSQDITWMRFIGSPLIYQRTFTVRFYEVPFE